MEKWQIVTEANKQQIFDKIKEVAIITKAYQIPFKRGKKYMALQGFAVEINSLNGTKTLLFHFENKLENK